MTRYHRANWDAHCACQWPSVSPTLCQTHWRCYISVLGFKCAACDGLGGWDTDEKKKAYKGRVGKTLGISEAHKSCSAAPGCLFLWKTRVTEKGTSNISQICSVCSEVKVVVGIAVGPFDFGVIRMDHYNEGNNEHAKPELLEQISCIK